MVGKLDRKALSDAVRAALGEDGIWELKKGYSNDAGKKWKDGSYAACLAEAARKGKPYAEAAFECAQKAKLGEKYAQLWG